MTYSPAIQPINPDPGVLTLLVIGTAENVRAHILRQHTLGVAEAVNRSQSPIAPAKSCARSTASWSERNSGDDFT